MAARKFRDSRRMKAEILLKWPGSRHMGHMAVGTDTLGRWIIINWFLNLVILGFFLV